MTTQINNPNQKNKLSNLKKELASLTPKDYNEVIKSIKSIEINKKLIEYLHIDSEYLKNISNLKFKPYTSYSDDPNDEYSEFINCDMDISYEYNIKNNENVTVNFEVSYSKTQTYDNRSYPNINCETKLDVSNNLNDVDYDYEENEEVINNYLDNKDRSWEYLINKILKNINGCKINWFHFLENF